MTKKQSGTPTQVKLSTRDRQLLGKLVYQLDSNISQIIRKAIRELAKREKIQ